MHKDIEKQEFLKLCEALEKGNITLEEFRIISNIEDEKEIDAILKLMSVEGIKYKKEIVQEILKQDNKRWKSEVLTEIFTMYPIFKNDKKRQKFALEMLRLHPMISKSVIILFHYDFLWNNKEFKERVENVVKFASDKKEFTLMNELVNITNILIVAIEKDRSLYEKEEVIKHLDKAFKLPNCEVAEDYIYCLKIEDFYTEPILLDCLISAYNEMRNNSMRLYNSTYYEKLNEVKENGKFTIIANKLKEIANSELPEVKKDKLILNLFDNITKIEKEIIETYNDEHFKYLIEHAVGTEKFYETKELVELAKNGNITFEEAKEMKETLENIEWDNVRSMVLQAYLNDKNLFTKEELEWFKKASCSDAQLRIAELSQKKNSQVNLKDSISCFGERFPNSFIEYLNDPDLTKEELLTIRDKVITLESELVKEERTFIVDTSSIVDEESKEQTEEKEEVTKGKSIVKRIISKFQK